MAKKAKDFKKKNCMNTKSDSRTVLTELNVLIYELFEKET